MMMITDGKKIVMLAFSLTVQNSFDNMSCAKFFVMNPEG